MSRSPTFLFLALLVGYSAAVKSETINLQTTFTQVALDSQPEENTQVDPPAQETNKAESLHEGFSQGIQATADRIDRFFGDERTDDEAAYTRLRLSVTTSFRETQSPTTNFHLHGKVVLPRISRRIQLIISGDDEERDSYADGDESGSVASRYLIKQTDKSRINFDAGFRGGINSPRFFTKLEYRYQREIAPWLSRLNPKLLWDTDDGLQATILFDLERKLSESTYFRNRTVPGWYENTDGYRLDQDFVFFIRLSNHEYLAFDWLNDFVTKPESQLEISRLRVRYRRPIWQDKLFFEISTGMRFEEKFDYESEAEGYIKLEMPFEAGKN